jgi:phosphatidylserine/phosphatidylglycerophosphate/cardiolipin synthase-like enzyme
MADALEDLAASGMQPAALAATLDLVGAALESRPSIDDVVDLVTTVPDATRVANRDTGVVVGELFRKACKSVLVAGYAVYQGKKVFQALAERMTELPHLNVRMFLDIQRGNGDTSSADELVRRFAHRFRTSEWPAGARIPQIHYDPRALSLDRNLRAALHAKCVVVDHTDVFISSANFTEAAQRRNIEVGLLVHSPLTACRVTEFFNNLVQAKLFLSVN